MTDDDRLLRLRLEGLAPPTPRRPRGAPRFLGRVVDGGALPTVAERFVLLEPARLDGVEAEGSGAAVAVDASRRVPALWLGPKAPAAGDLAVAHDAGGRWVVDRLGPGTTTVACGACTLPRTNLTLTWTNNLLGTHSAPMAFDGVDEWATGCVNQIAFRLSCRSGVMTFTATYFVSGSCPTGQPIACSSPGSSPTGLTASAASCDPLFLQYTATPCPALAAQGYTRFTVTR